MQSLVYKAGITDEVRAWLLAAYRRLGPGAVVAVRSSATGEDGRDASFAGMNETITNVSGEDGLIDAVQHCWASLFSPRVITYRANRGFAADPAMAVVVQLMIPAEQAGVAFTADPSTGAVDRVVIEAAFGQGEVVVSGRVEPDTYVVAKDKMKLLDARVGHKTFKIVRGPDGARPKRPVETRRQADSRVLDDAALRRIASWRSQWNGTTKARKTWNGRSRPARPGSCKPGRSRPCTPDAPRYRSGHRAGSGGCPPPRAPLPDCASPAHTGRGDRLARGEVLVAPMTNPDWLPTIRRAAALVTDTGGMTCHAAIVARE